MGTPFDSPHVHADIQSFIDLLPVAIQLSDLDGVIVVENARHAELHGRAPGELLGARVWDLCEDAAGVRRLHGELLSARPDPSPCFAIHVTSAGERFPVRVDWSYWRDEHGLTKGLAATILPCRVSWCDPCMEAVVANAIDAVRSLEAACGLAGANVHLPRPPESPALPLESVLGRLTSREREVLQSILEGRQPHSIAHQLSISVHTVRNHLKNIYRKVGVSSREELFALFVRAADLAPGTRSPG